MTLSGCRVKISASAVFYYLNIIYKRKLRLSEYFNACRKVVLLKYALLFRKGVGRHQQTLKRPPVEHKYRAAINQALVTAYIRSVFLLCRHPLMRKRLVCCKHYLRSQCGESFLHTISVYGLSFKTFIYCLTWFCFGMPIIHPFNGYASFRMRPLWYLTKIWIIRNKTR